MRDVRLQVMICTYKEEGLRRVAKMNLPRVEEVSYLVSCQSEPHDLPATLVRDDVEVSFTDSIGLSNNRNHALSKSTAPYLLIADDDEEFNPDGLKSIIQAFDINKDIDIATFRCEMGDDKVYPTTVHDLAKGYKNYNIASIEVALRREAIFRIGALFSPLMGIGAKYLHAGEENVFILSCLKRGLKGRFFPVTIAKHAASTTGVRESAKQGVIRAKGAYIAMAYPYTALLRLPLEAYRAHSDKMRYLYNLVWGACYGVLNRKKILYPKP